MVCWIMDLKELLEVGVDVSKCFCLQGCAVKNGRYVSDLTIAENLLRPLFSCFTAMLDSNNPKGRGPRPWPWVNVNSPVGRQAKLVF